MSMFFLSLFLTVGIYFNTGIITDVNCLTDVVIVTDTAGEEWRFYSSDNWQPGDSVTMIMYNAGTKVITDDIIVNVETTPASVLTVF